MTDEPNNPPEETSDTPPSDPDETRREGSNASAAGTHDKKAAGSPEAAEDAGTLPPPPDADQPRPTPESQAAQTGKAPSGSSTSGTTVPADSGETAQTPTPSPKPGPPAAPPSNETPEETKARAAAAKEAAAAKAPADSAGAAKPTPTAAKPAPAAAGAAAAGAPKAPVKKKDEGPKPQDASDHALVKRLRERFNDAITGAFTFVGQLSVHVRGESIVEICRSLRDDAETPFDYLSDLTCVHWPERDGEEFEVVYNLYSVPKNERVRLKAGAGEAGVGSVTSVWPAANWMEREAYDLFGVTFEGHPDLRRILLPADWDGHPLRKDYPLEFMENGWTTRHLPVFDEVQREQLAQRRAYGLEILQTPDERRIRELFRDGRDPLPKEHK